MANYDYKCIAFRASISSSSGVQEIANQLQSAIKQYATDGWEFCNVSHVSTTVNPGCLGGMLGKKQSTVSYDVIVFRKAM